MNKIIEDDIKTIYQEFGEIIREMKNSTVLLTGACGMITTYLAFFLIKNADALNMDIYLQCRNLEKAKKIYNEHLNNSHVHFTQMQLDAQMNESIHFDYIIHGASPAGTEHFVKNPVGVINPNVLGTWNLLEYSRKNNIKKFIFMSSNSIYGVSSKKELTEEDYGYVEPLGIRACYIESKRMGEQLCAAYSRQFNVNTGIVRICHTYGPTFDIENDTRAIPRFVRSILANENIEIYKDPNSVIQYTYAADTISGILCVLCKGKAGEAYNVCADDLVTMDQVVSYMINADSNIKSKLIEKPIDENYAFGQGNGINFSKLDNKKISNIGWKQLYTAENGFKRMMASYLGD